MMAIERSMKILNPEGMHARPAGIFVKKASEFKCKIEIRANGQTKNAKSIMNLMSLGLQKDTEVTLVADGDDAPQALDVLSTLVQNQFKLPE